MPIEDIDIWRTARAMIKQYGKDAPLQAAKRADQFMAEGNLEAQRTWQRIAAAIDELLDVSPKGPRH